MQQMLHENFIQHQTLFFSSFSKFCKFLKMREPIHNFIQNGKITMLDKMLDRFAPKCWIGLLRPLRYIQSYFLKHFCVKALKQGKTKMLAGKKKSLKIVDRQAKKRSAKLVGRQKRVGKKC